MKDALNAIHHTVSAGPAKTSWLLFSLTHHILPGGTLLPLIILIIITSFLQT